LLVALACAIAAELLRNFILGQTPVRFAQDPGWYFGSWELRMSGRFWTVMFERFLDASAKLAGYPYIALLIVACHPVFKVDRTVIFAAAVAFFAGWLLFPLLYLTHDYYQLPCMIIAYLAIAIAARGVWNFIAGKLPPLGNRHFRGLHYEHFLVVGIAGAALAVHALSQDFDKMKRTSIYDALEHALRSEQWFLYVDADANFESNVIPERGTIVGPCLTKPPYRQTTIHWPVG
jgi:hypothetical protein